MGKVERACHPLDASSGTAKGGREMNKPELKVDLEVDERSVNDAVARIESAFPKIIFRGDVKNVYISYYYQRCENEEATP